MRTLALLELQTAPRMYNTKEYQVSWDGHEGIRVKARSFMGAMRAAFGPGDYQDAGEVDINQRRVRWPGETADTYFVVTLRMD